MKPVFVQRVCKNRNDFDASATVDSHFHMVYMGSAEFERPELRASMSKVCSQLSHFAVYPLTTVQDCNGDSLRVFSWCEDKQYQSALMALWRNEQSVVTKEAVGLWEATRPMAERRYPADVWWDIHNHVFFCFGDDAMEQWITALRNTRREFKKAGRL